MAADLVIANFLRVAKEDLDGAKLLARTKNRNAVYLCGQAAEKVLRAVLTSESKHGGITHRLNEMVDLVPDENPLKPALRGIEELSAYATAYRYPTPAGRIPEAPTDEELSMFFAKVEAALDLAVSKFGVDLDTVGQPARRPGPIRQL
ncbi:MAG TPA: HEPN domain-containing protein [Myxococcales bacterium]